MMEHDRGDLPSAAGAAKPEPHFGMPQAATAHDTFWDFAGLMPEITHMLLWTMSDRAIPRSYRTMQGFGVNTYRFVNARDESVFVKFHWNPMAGTHSACVRRVRPSNTAPACHSSRAITAIATATAEGLRRVAEATQVAGGYEAVSYWEATPDTGVGPLATLLVRIPVGEMPPLRIRDSDPVL